MKCIYIDYALAVIHEVNKVSERKSFEVVFDRKISKIEKLSAKIVTQEAKKEVIS